MGEEKGGMRSGPIRGLSQAQGETEHVCVPPCPPPVTEPPQTDNLLYPLSLNFKPDFLFVLCSLIQGNDGHLLSH